MQDVICISTPTNICRTCVLELSIHLSVQTGDMDYLPGWIFLVWAFCLQFTKTDEVKDDIKFETTSLFHQRPSAVRKLTNLMERWGKHQKRICPSTFKASVHRHTAGPTLAFKRSRKASSVNGFLARFCRGHLKLQGG